MLHSDIGRSRPLVLKRIIVARGGVIFEIHDAFKDLVTEPDNQLEVNVLDDSQGRQLNGVAD